MKISLLVVSMLAAGEAFTTAPAINRASVTPQFSNSRIFSVSDQHDDVDGELDTSEKGFDPVPAAMAAFITLSSSPAFADSPDWGTQSRRGENIGELCRIFVTNQTHIFVVIRRSL